MSRAWMGSVLGLAVTLLLMGGEPLAAQDASLEILVHDLVGEPLRGVAVAVERGDGLEVGVRLTGAEGRIRFDGLERGEYRIAAYRIGYRSADGRVQIRSGEAASLTVRMTPGAVPLEGVRVVGEGAEGRERRRFLEEAGLTAHVVGGDDLRALPSLGEADVLRVIELMPGVVSPSDFVAAYNVRGGSADQNLVLLDGFPLFNPFHLGGLFSVFNPDVVARAELFTGGFGAEYGGRVSSVLNVETASTLGVEAGGDAGVSLLATRLALRTPLPPALAGIFGGAEAGVLVSGRRSYLDWVLRPVVDFPYHLTDLQSRLDWETAGGGELALILYGGLDVFDLREVEGLADDFLRLRVGWGNRLAGVHWAQPVGRFGLDVRGGWSDFFNDLEFPDFDDIELSSRIGQGTVRADLHGPLGERVELAVGLEANRIAFRNIAAAGGTEFSGQEDDGFAGAGYGQLRWQPTPAWRVETGLRADGWWGATTRGVVSPRVAVRRYFGGGAEPRFAVRAAAGRYSQFLHSLRDEELPFAIDTWVLAGEGVPPIVSDQVQVGGEWRSGTGWMLSADAFVRGFDGITDLNPAADPNDPTDELLVGTGRAYGADAFLRRLTGRFRGWAALSLVHVRHTFPDPLRPAGDDGRPVVSFPPIHDRRVSLDLVALTQVGERTELSARWGFGTGLPYTRPIAQHEGWDYDFGTGRYVPPREGGSDRRFVVLGERNRERYPAYHRLDLGIRRSWTPRWGEVTAFGQVVNAYDRRENVLFYFYDFASDPPTRSGFSMLPILPTVGVEVSW